MIRTILWLFNVSVFFASENGKICVDGVRSYTCKCPPGLTGKSCQIGKTVLCLSILYVSVSFVCVCLTALHVSVNIACVCLLRLCLSDCTTTCVCQYYMCLSPLLVFV